MAGHTAGIGMGIGMGIAGWARIRAGGAVAASVVLVAACVAGPGGPVGGGGSGTPATAAPSYLQGGVNNGGGGGGQAGSGPHTPRATGVAFFDPAQHATLELGTIEGQLNDEGYPDAQWFDSAEGAPGHEGATVASFKTLANDGIAVIDAFGDSQVLAVEAYCDPLEAVNVMETKYEADLDAGYLMITDIPTDGSCDKQLNHDEQAWTNKIVASDPSRLVVHFINEVPDPGPIRWAIGLTQKGVQAYLGKGKLSLLFLSTCRGATLLNGLNLDAVFSYVGCGPYPTDITALFNSLYGSDGVAFRGTDTAYDHIKGAANGLTYRQGGGPVLLAPAVVKVDPPEGHYLKPGSSTPVTITFDTEMAQGDPVTIDGCGASIDGVQSWNGDHTQVQFTIKVADHPTDNQIHVTVKNAKATADPASGWPNVLAGNQQGVGTNGKGPNGDDYVYSLACVEGLDLAVDGVFNREPVAGRLIGQGLEPPRVVCDPITGFDGAVTYMHVQVFGVTSDTNTPVAADWTAKIGSSSIGDQVGDSTMSFDMNGVPQRHLGGISGSVTATVAGGSIDATGVDGADSLHIVGTWTCPGASAAP